MKPKRELIGLKHKRELILRFRTYKEMHDFVGGLLDGWGEDCGYDYAWADGKTAWNKHPIEVTPLEDEPEDIYPADLPNS